MVILLVDIPILSESPNKLMGNLEGTRPMPPPPQKIAGLMKGFLRDIDGLHNVLIPMHKHPRFDFHGLFFEVPNYPLDKGAPSSSERIFCPWNFHLRFGHFSRFSGTFFVILFELDLVLVTNF